MSAPATYAFCPQCGHSLEKKVFDRRERPYCPSCEWMYFEDPKVAVAVMVEEGPRILLVQRTVTPHIGKWTLPAGFVDAHEDPKDAAIRECMEETGLKVEIQSLIEVISGREHPEGADIVLLYRAKVIEGGLVVGEDVSGAKFFAPSELPEVAFKATARALAIWGNNRAP